ncbi:MAG: DUF5596 domain-containing protein [Clostridia bacterium]|nr:DUF5596 domain-containing protein [Clostridia bacterium]
MNVTEFMKLTEYSQQAINVFNEMAVSEEIYLAKKEQYYSDEEDFLTQLKEEMGDKYYPALLFYFTRFAVELRDKYIQMGFSEEEYLHTFCDLKTWTDMCILETGICGLRETGWLTSHMHAGIVRFGRMQFQPDTVEEDIVLSNTVIKAGTKILNVHIPFGGALSVDEVSSSLARAKAHFGESFVHAESWLLDPTLPNYLSSTSNILAFAKLFERYKVEESNSIERFVFRVIKEDKNEYVAESSFAKKIKQALLEGEKFYSGYGVMKL